VETFKIAPFNKRRKIKSAVVKDEINANGIKLKKKPKTQARLKKSAWFF